MRKNVIEFIDRSSCQRCSMLEYLSFNSINILHPKYLDNYHDNILENLFDVNPLKYRIFTLDITVFSSVSIMSLDLV